MFFWWEKVKFHVIDLLCLKCSDNIENGIFVGTNSPYIIMIFQDYTNLNSIVGPNKYSIRCFEYSEIFKHFSHLKNKSFKSEDECKNEVEGIIKNLGYKILSENLEIFK